MKILILNTDYPEFLSWLYTQHPGLEKGSYEEQMLARVESLNSEADFYSRNLRKLGYEADDIFANNEFMQRAWARENGVRLERPTEVSQRWRAMLRAAKAVTAKAPLRYLRHMIRPFVPTLNGWPPWFYTILEAQIKHYRPDVLYNQDLIGISPWFLKQVKAGMRLLVGQHAAPLLGGDRP